MCRVSLQSAVITEEPWRQQSKRDCAGRQMTGPSSTAGCCRATTVCAFLKHHAAIYPPPSPFNIVYINYIFIYFAVEI